MAAFLDFEFKRGAGTDKSLLVRSRDAHTTTKALYCLQEHTSLGLRNYIYNKATEIDSENAEGNSGEATKLLENRNEYRINQGTFHVGVVETQIPRCDIWFPTNVMARSVS